MSRSKAPLIRRIPGEDGVLVTYLPAADAADLVSLASTTVIRWMKTGAVRTTDKLNGCRNVAVVDCARLKMMTPRESLEAGIRRVPQAELRMQYDWFTEEQRKTATKASSHRQPWDEFDSMTLMTMYGQGRPVEEIAEHLARTYAGVCSQINRLRAEGDLPEVERPQDAWWPKTRGLLTPDEALSLDDSAERLSLTEPPGLEVAA